MRLAIGGSDRAASPPSSTSGARRKTMVNPLVHIVKEEILAGTLHPQHRIFLTYLDDVLQNVILISPMSAEHNGYLMDLEFYPPDMPLGGLEFAIVKIIETLVAEGCDVLSLGGTYGCKLEPSAHATRRSTRSWTTCACRTSSTTRATCSSRTSSARRTGPSTCAAPRAAATPDNVIDIIMMIADPAKDADAGRGEPRRRAGRMAKPLQPIAAEPHEPLGGAGAA